MKVFFFLGQTFFDQSVLMASQIEKLQPGSEFSAIVCARYDLMQKVENLQGPKFSRYDWLNALEKQWLATPLDKEKLQKYETLLGTESLRRILIADRELAYGYVSCGRVETSKLIEITRYDDDARWRYVLGLVDYMFTTFSQIKPDVTFSYCVAGAVAMAIGEISKHLGILFIQPVFTRIKHYHIIDDNPTSDFTSVIRTYKAATTSPKLLANHTDEANKFLAEFRSKPVKPQDSVTWISLILKTTSLPGIAKTIAIDCARWAAILLGLKGTKGVLRQRKGHAILLSNLRNILTLRKLARKKHRCFSYDFPTGDYIYYPLHVDPEASTMVLSPFHTDQATILESISKNMPAGMKLVVKEHLPCAGKRPSWFYERIRSIPGVTLVSPFVDNFTLMKNAALIATITGTAGLEAIILGKPALIFGPVQYQIIGEGFIYHPEINSGLGNAIKNSLALKPADDANIIRYIASIMREGVELSPDDLWFEKVADLSNREQATHKIVDKIIENLESLETNKIAA